MEECYTNDLENSFVKDMPERFELEPVMLEPLHCCQNFHLELIKLHELQTQVDGWQIPNILKS